MKPISISNGAPAILPSLLIFFALSMVKDAIEDYYRHKRDEEENNSKCTI